VLLAMGIDADIARGAIRASFGASNTLIQVQQFLTVLENECARLRNLTAVAA
jgi:cysteine desulfurase